MLLSEVKKNHLVEITRVLQDQILNEEDHAFVLRMLELGLRPGAKVRMQHVAPLGDPVSFEVNGGVLGVTRKQCRFFEVSEVKE